MNTYSASQQCMRTDMPGHEPAMWRAPAWDLVVLPRVSKPPLRFRGRCLSRDQVMIGPNDELFICLWQKQKGGWVVAHSTPADSGSGVDAVGVDTCHAAMAYLEERCAQLPPVSMPELVSGHSAADLISKIARQCNFHQQFLVLAGHAMARWDAWADEPAGT